MNTNPGNSPTAAPTTSSSTTITTTTNSSSPPPSQGETGGGTNNNDADDNGGISKPVIDCGIDENGDVNAVPDASKSFVDYKYKIITDPGSANLQTEVLPVLEKKILETILPDIFQCETGARHLSLNLRNSRRKLALLGASANPPDLVSLSELCQADTEAQECNVVDGMMTFYHDSNNFDSSSIKALTCDALNGDALKMAHPAIMGLECILNDPASIPESGNGIDKGGPSIDPPTQRITTPVAVMSALAAVMVIMGVYVYRRRKKMEDEIPPHKKHLDDSDVNNSNSVSFEDLPMAWAAQSKGNGLAFDMKSIVPNGYNPETIKECPVEDEEEELDEVSLDQLEMNVDDSDLT